MLGFYSRRRPTAHIVHLDFNAADPVQQARRLVLEAAGTRSEPLCLLIDCRHLRCLRTHGAAHFVTQLLLIRRMGAGLLLHNVPPLLARLLHLLGLDNVVELTRPFRPQPGLVLDRSAA
jgi:anti-anti-sigma regulatory factor